MAKRFGAGLATGILASVGAIAAGAFTYKKKVLDPEIEQENKIEENRIKANRKSHVSHQA
ncbi:DUF3042 family protein [Lactobacillus sp. PV034]|uniref:DUF3042 family protein n=1 Tax=Lactobacillus sp. PV034 TaxID=2594495 RepID=UPI00223EC870|nr:DUF3042 family protein [Lactobacillus sp. PV034]QNQ80188.1 DUF3042 family protein [Lactobacillus sp. PV034]